MEVNFHFTTAGDHEAIPLVTGRSLLIYKVWLRPSLGSNTVTFKAGAATIFGPVEVDRMSELSIGEAKADPIFELPVSTPFVIHQTVNKPISGKIFYAQG